MDRSSGVLLIQDEDSLLGASACQSPCVCDFSVGNRELMVLAADVGACSRLDIRSGLGVRSGSPKPPLATALLDSLLAEGMIKSSVKEKDGQDPALVAIHPLWKVTS